MLPARLLLVTREHQSLVSQARLSRGGAVVAFFGMLFTERGIITEDLPMQNTSQFMFTPTSLDALLLSMQYQSLMGI